MLWEYMKKAGIVAEDDGGQPKVKLYRNADGSLKGDGTFRLMYTLRSASSFFCWIERVRAS